MNISGKIIVGLLLIASSMVNGAVQIVNGSYWWMRGTGDLNNDNSVFEPTAAYVATGGTSTFAAKPGDGMKPVGWYRWNGSKPILLKNFVLVSNGETLLWTYDSTLGSPVTLGLELDWISYTLKYDAEASTHHLYTNKVIVADCSTLRTGYDFGGAWTNAAGVAYVTGRSVTGADFSIPNHNDEAVVVLYPKWTPRSFDVTLDRQEGMGGTATIVVTYDQLPSTLVVPTREGYVFDGYYTQEGGKGTRYYAADGTPSQAWKETAVTRLYANWIINRYEVSVSASGNGTVSLSPAGGIYSYGQKVNLTATPKDEGTDFAGWSDGVTTNLREVVVSSNVTLVARFVTKSFQVLWKDSSVFGSVILKEETVLWGKDATKPDTPEHVGYEFSGWTEDGKDIRTNTTIVAKYSVNQYVVWMDKNDGSANPERKSCTYTYGKPEYLPLNEFVRRGYAFQGWGTNRTDKTVVLQDGAQVWNWATQGSVDIYAIWKANEYSVRFDPGEGSGSMEDQAFVYDQAQELSENNFVCGDRSFLGWKDNDARTYENGQTVSNLTETAGGVVVLTAQWSQTVHVAFDGNGATNHEVMAVQDFNGPDDMQCLASNCYGRVGYTFIGWATNREDAAAQKIRYRDGERVKINASAGSTITLFATWKANTYYVSFDPGAGHAAVPLTMLTATYDQGFALPDVQGHYVAPNPDLDGFDCWTSSIGRCKYENRAIVSNLCTECGATNVLIATWKLDVGELSERMHCTTLRWSLALHRSGFTPQWSNSGVVSQVKGGYKNGEWLQATVRTNGTLKLSCRLTGGAKGEALGVGFVSQSTDDNFNWTDRGMFATNISVGTSGEWVPVGIPVALRPEESQVVIRLANTSLETGAVVEVDQVEWIPEGTVPGGDEPKEGEDNPTVKGMAVKDGKIVIKTTSDTRFGYRILRSLSLVSPVTWVVLEGSYQDGKDETLEFELPIGSDMPQAFYKVEVLKKQK